LKSMALNERRRRFAEYYAASGNATEAAVAAGYSKKTARSQGQRLLTNADILQYVRLLQDKASSVRIASVTQAKAFWSDVMRDPTEKTADRLKASELLAKAAGEFVHIRPDAVDGFDIATGEAAGEDVVIYIPKMLTENECEAAEND